jgi:hypothetical protein
MTEAAAPQKGKFAARWTIVSLLVAIAAAVLSVMMLG